MLHPIRIIAVCLLFAIAGCNNAPSDKFSGYVEGEYLYVSSPLPGTVAMQVERGSSVKAGDPLFAIENVPEMTERDEARRRLAQARATLNDIRKGRRPSELAALQAQLQQARAALALSETEYARNEKLFRTGSVSAQGVDRAKSLRDQDRQAVARFEAELQTAKLGARSDQISAAGDNVRALEDVLARAQWNLSRKSQRAPEDALVFDTLFRTGEWVAAGRPVVSLLPPRNIKVRVFIPQNMLGVVHAGTSVRVAVDGVQEEFAGTVSYISPRAEYTPPVIYSRESRSKLVFMVEANFPPETAAKLHPGQPVDLRFGR